MARLGQLPNKGMFASARTDNEQLHRRIETGIWLTATDFEQDFYDWTFSRTRVDHPTLTNGHFTLEP
jgi:hypothetical protein